MKDQSKTKQVLIQEISLLRQKIAELEQSESDRKNVEEALQESSEWFRKLFERHTAIMLILDAEMGTIIDANEAAADFYGWPIEELKQMRIQDINTLPIEAVKAEMKKAALLERTRFEFRHRRADGSIRDVEVFSNKIEIAGKDLLYSIIRDNTERKRMEAELRASEEKYRELSIVDDLTELYNSRHFYQQLKMEIDRVDRYGQPLTLLLLDLDDFKQFNDTYGHIEGDQVLARFGQVVKRCLRQTDSAYRYGGEEFTILLPMTTIGDGAVTAERIRAELREEIFSPVSGKDVHMTVSIGLAQYKSQEDMKTFVNRLDQLMYQAKKSGKDRVRPELY